MLDEGLVGAYGYNRYIGPVTLEADAYNPLRHRREHAAGRFP